MLALAATRIGQAGQRAFRRIATARAYARVFAGDDGQMVLHDLVRRGGLLRTSVDARPGLTEFNEGRRALVLDILRELNLGERDFERMTRDIIDADRHEE